MGTNSGITMFSYFNLECLEEVFAESQNNENRVGLEALIHDCKIDFAGPLYLEYSLPYVNDCIG